MQAGRDYDLLRPDAERGQSGGRHLHQLPDRHGGGVRLLPHHHPHARQAGPEGLALLHDAHWRNRLHPHALSGHLRRQV